MSYTLYLVRHCQPTRQNPDAPLTETGQQQVKRKLLALFQVHMLGLINRLFLWLNALG
jgi:broad specificity phosphatase PhoE